MQVVAMDGFTGFKTATTEELPDAIAVMGPFQVVRLTADAMDGSRRRVQQDTCGHRGHAGDPLYASRRTLHTGVDLLNDKQKARLLALFPTEAHLPVEVSWNIYQDMIAAYRNPDRTAGRTAMSKLIDTLSSGVPAALTELVTLGRTLKRRAAPPTTWPTSTVRGRAPAPPMPSTADSSTSTAALWASATSPTTSPDACSRRAGSGPDYTLDCEEPPV